MGCRKHKAAPAARTELKSLDRVFRADYADWGEIDMIKHLPPPTAADEYRNTAEILRDLAAQVRFGKTRNELVNLADNLDRLAAHAERQICGALELSLSPAASALDSDEPQRQHAWRKFPE